MSAFGVEILAFGPHPDDVELFCGGLLLGAADRGHRTAVVDLTRGEMSSRGDPETRAAEAEAAAHMLGLLTRENLDLPDAWLDARAGDPAEGVRTPVARIAEVIRRLRPEIVVAPWSSERHPDHEAASALVTRAVFLAGLRRFETRPTHDAFVPRQVLYYPMRHVAEPTLVVDVTAAWERKRAAILCYASQVLPDPAAPPTLVGSDLALPALEARDRFYGARIGVAYGEPYILRETPGLADPVDHFRRNAFARPLFFPERTL